MQFSDEQVEIFDKEDMDAKNLHFWRTIFQQSPIPCFATTPLLGTAAAANDDDDDEQIAHLYRWHLRHHKMSRVLPASASYLVLVLLLEMGWCHFLNSIRHLFTDRDILTILTLKAYLILMF